MYRKCLYTSYILFCNISINIYYIYIPWIWGIVSHLGLKSPMVFCRALFWVLSFSPYICFHSVIFFRNIIYHIISMPTTQLYFHVKNNNCSMSNLFACLQDIKCWMDLNFLQLNNDENWNNGFWSNSCVFWHCQAAWPPVIKCTRLC